MLRVETVKDISIKDAIRLEDNIVSYNRINSTVELKGIEFPEIEKDVKYNVLMYFNILDDNSPCSMLVVKVEKTSMLNILKYRLNLEPKLEGFVGCVSFTKWNGILVTYIRNGVVNTM